MIHDSQRLHTSVPRSQVLPSRSPWRESYSSVSRGLTYLQCAKPDDSGSGQGALVAILKLFPD